MANIMMLDYDETLVNHFIGQEVIARPDAAYFLDRCTNELFDQCYVNTAGNTQEEVTRSIDSHVGRFKLGYWNWVNQGPYGKANGFQQFVGDTIIFVEDSMYMSEDKYWTADDLPLERLRMRELGVYFLPVHPWHPMIFMNEQGSQPDLELRKTLRRMEEILGY